VVSGKRKQTPTREVGPVRLCRIGPTDAASEAVAFGQIVRLGRELDAAGRAGTSRTRATIAVTAHSTMSATVPTTIKGSGFIVASCV